MRYGRFGPHDAYVPADATFVSPRDLYVPMLPGDVDKDDYYFVSYEPNPYRVFRGFHRGYGQQVVSGLPVADSATLREVLSQGAFWGGVVTGLLVAVVLKWVKDQV